MKLKRMSSTMMQNAVHAIVTGTLMCCAITDVQATTHSLGTFGGVKSISGKITSSEQIDSGGIYLDGTGTYIHPQWTSLFSTSYAHVYTFTAAASGTMRISSFNTSHPKGDGSVSITAQATHTTEWYNPGTGEMPVTKGYVYNVQVYSARAYNQTFSFTLSAPGNSGGGGGGGGGGTPSTNMYRITLNHNGGGNGDTDVWATYGEAMPFIWCPSRAGYAFLGYWTTATSGGTKYYDSYGNSVRNWDQRNTATLYARWENRTGTISMTVGSVTAGGNLKVTIHRTGGSEGRVAVKLKTQDSSTVNGINGVMGRDFQYVKEYLVWSDGDTSDRIVYVPTYVTDSTSTTTFRLKLTAQTTGAYSNCMTPVLASNGKVIASIAPASRGSIVVSSPSSMVVTAGDSLSVTVRRTGGSAGRVAIMLKTQGHTEVSNLTAESGKDFSYVNEVLTWSSGDTSSRTVEIPTRVGWWQGDDKTFRIKLTALTTAAYEGYVTPDIPDKKIVAYIESNDDYLQDQSGHGTVMVTSVRSVNCCMARLYDTVYEPPFWGYADDTLYVTVSRMGGSDGRVAVKAKTQDASTVNGITGYFLKDFDYVKEYLVWEDGDDSDRIIEIPTYLVRGVIYPRTFRLKLSALTTGEFADCATPVLPEPKVIISLEEESQVEKTHGLR